MSRNDVLLRNLDVSAQSGLEIGALDKPVVPPTARVFYVDHMDTPSLVEKYREDPGVNLDKIVHVSGVWGEQTLAEVAASVAPVDYIVASHVIEHVPSLVGWLSELAAALKPEGEVRLAIPDRRHTFDYLRRETQLWEVLEAHVAQARRPSAGRVLDFCLGFRNVDCWRSWHEQIDPGALNGQMETTTAIELATDVIQNGKYHDVHCWVFTPTSFAQLMEQLARFGLVPFGCSMFHDTAPDTFEFFVGLRRCPDPALAADSWAAVARELQLAEACEQEARTKSRVDELIAENQALREHAERLQQTVDAMRASTSWRLTAPLRAVRRKRGA